MASSESHRERSLQVDLHFLECLSRSSSVSLRSQVARYVGELESYLFSIESGITNGDAEAVREGAHKLVGHARLIDAQDLIIHATSLLAAAHSERIFLLRLKAKRAVATGRTLARQLHRVYAARA